MEIKNYLIGCATALAVSFGVGVYVGYTHSRDIEYALCKVEKEAYMADRSLKKWAP